MGQMMLAAAGHLLKAAHSVRCMSPIVVVVVVVVGGGVLCARDSRSLTLPSVFLLLLCVQKQAERNATGECQRLRLAMQRNEVG